MGWIALFVRDIRLSSLDAPWLFPLWFFGPPRHHVFFAQEFLVDGFAFLEFSLELLQGYFAGFEKFEIRWECRLLFQGSPGCQN